MIQKMKAWLTHGLTLEPRELSRIFAITLPAMLELVLSQLFGMVDTIMLGHTANAKIAIAAVGFTNNPTNLLLGILSAFNVGTTASIAWSIGAGDIKQGRDLARTALSLNLILGAIATTIGVVFAPAIVTFMGAEAEPFPFAVEYMRIVAWGFLAAAVNMSVTATLRAAGQTRLPMVYNLGANLLNVLGNWVLIYGHWGFPAMGVNGAAISTTFSRIVGAVTALVTLFFVDTQVRLRLRDGLLLRLSHIKRILRIGTTTAIEQALMQVGFMLFAKQVAGLGTTMFAAHQIGLNINGLSWVPAQAFGVASTTLVGQYMGAGEPERARDCARIVHRAALLGSVPIVILFLLGAHVIAGLYSPGDAEVVLIAAAVLRIMMLGMPGIATQQPIASALRGAGDAMFPLIASCAGIWIFRVLLAPFFIGNWGLNGAWLCISLDQTCRALVVYWRFRQGGWMKRARRLANS